MLILARRIGETVRLNDDITVTILGVDDCQVKLGVNAPSEIIIHREEVYQRIQKQAASAHRVGVTAE